MRGVTFHGPKNLSVESVPDPAIEAPRDAIVKVELTAVCGSDLHVWRGHETGLDAGTVLGHEFAGEIVEVGRDVTTFSVGDRVIAPFTTSCGACWFCQHDLTCRCSSGQLFGWREGGHGLHGAQAELVRVPLADATLVRAPEDVDLEAALLCGDVLATGMFCARSGGVGPGMFVAVLGCGPVGLMAIVAARELGAERVFAVDSVVERLMLASRFGATPLDLSLGDPCDAVREATDGRGADVVLEAVGSPQATRLAVDLARLGATIAACGVHTEDAFAFTPVEAYDKNLTYAAGRCPARALAEPALDVVRSRKYPIGEIVSHRMSLEEAPRAYQMFDAKQDGCTKVVLSPCADGVPR